MNPQEIKEALSAVIHYNGTLSMKKPAGLFGDACRGFEEMILPQFNLSVWGEMHENFVIETEG